MQYEDDYTLELEKEMKEQDLKQKKLEKELDELLILEWERKHQYVCEIYQ